MGHVNVLVPELACSLVVEAGGRDVLRFAVERSERADVREWALDVNVDPGSRCTVQPCSSKHPAMLFGGAYGMQRTLRLCDAIGSLPAESGDVYCEIECTAGRIEITSRRVLDIVLE